MPEISGLYVNIGVNSSELEKGMNKAQKSVNDFSSSMAAAAKKAVAYFAAFASAKAMYSFVDQTMQAIDATSKLARELGTTTESLATLQRAASYAGISSGELEQNLRILNRTIGDGIAGNDQARKVFEKLGLSIVEMAKANADERIISISEAMRGLNSNAERASALVDLFGRGGMKMSEIIMGGSEAMRQAADEARNLGLAVSAIDARQIEQANDAWERAKGVITGVGNTIAIKLAPYLDALAQKLTYTSTNASAVGKVIDSVMGGIAYAVSSAAASLDLLKLAFTGLHAIVVAVGYGMAKVFDIASSGFETGANKAISGINSVKGVWNDFISATQALPGGGIDESLKVGFTDPIQTATNAAAGMKAELDSIMASFAEQADGFEGISSRAQKIAEGFMKAEEASRNAAVSAENVNRQFFGGGEPQLQQTDSEKAAAEKAARELEQYRKQMNDKLAILVESHMNEEELLIAKKEKELAILQEGLDAKLLAEQDYRDLVEQVEFDHVQRMVDLRRGQMSDLEKFNAESWNRQVSDVAGALTDITASAAANNKQLFEINKIASIATAIVNAYEGITKTMAAYPYPINIGLAAAHASAAFAQVAAIRAQQFNGGGSGGAMAGSSSATASPAASSQAAATSGGASDKGAYIQINLQGGNMYSADQVRGLINAINEQVDGGMLIRGVQAG